MKMFWNASAVPEAAVRVMMLIAPLTPWPATWFQLRTRPEKIAWIWLWDKLPMRLRGFVITHTPSRAIL